MRHNNYCNYWCHMMIDRLISVGINNFFVAPGSRSTPIVSAIARHPLAIIHQCIDERSLGFMALGYGKRAQKAGVVVVTSGTAVANLMPAVVEARMSLVPMLLLTADRPYELRDTGANQTIEQANIFSNHVNKSYDLSSPSSIVSIKKSQSIFDQANRCAHVPRPGPVHINIQLREPLHNASTNQVWQEEEGLSHPLSFNKAHFRCAERLTAFCNSAKGLLVVGELFPSAVQEKIVKLAEKLGWPLFADITSNMRFMDHPLILHHFDLALNNSQFLKELDVDVVLHIGDRIVSKRFWAWVERSSHIKFLRLSEYENTIDHLGVMEHLWAGDLARTIDDINPLLKKCFMRENLLRAHDAVKYKVHQFLEQRDNNEAYIAAALVAAISEPVNLFISSSMPIRDLDQFALSSSQSIDVFANRGASGIDGIISSAAGVAIASVKPTILFMGDIAFLHDTNGLMLLKEAKNPILIIVVNNGGGAIFHFLPIATETDVVTPYLDTPHQVKIEALCRAHDVEHHIVSIGKYKAAIKDFFRTKKNQVIEISIDRETNVALHKKLYETITFL